jgi:Xaa-Pro aminopeptidase
MTPPLKINERIAACKGLMKREQLAAFIIPASDPHQSEYVCEHWKVREWTSGFSGSAGTLVITREQAVLWTDSRYYLQAEQELKSTDIQLFRNVTTDHQTYLAWLADCLEEGDVVGCNGWQLSVNQAKRMKKRLADHGILLDTQQDLAGELWKKRPPLPDSPIFELDEQYAGESRAHKLKRIRQAMLQKEVNIHLISKLDCIAWALNLRGSDVDCNPVFLSYLWIEMEEAFLFVDKEKVPTAVLNSLKKDGVEVINYRALSGFIGRLAPGRIVWIDPTSTNQRLYDWLKEQEAEFFQAQDAVVGMKAVKNQTEVLHLHQAMVKDGIALVKMKIWLETMLDRVMVTEYEVSKQLNRFRQSQGHFIDDSFHAIVGYNANGAIVHYRPQPTESLPIKPSGMLLIDSGGQYLEGTTDITRTFALGEPTEEQKTHYTLVLKGHIALSKAVFPKGTTGVQLDILARQYLWQRGLNYGHGTGHGVGFFLNVHEGPHSIGADPKGTRTTVPFQAGMIVSNEPGLYLEGQYGIRIENLILCVETDVKNEEGESYLGFHTLSLFPYDLNLIEGALLSVSEKEWIKDYHQRVFEELKPGLSPEEVEWLEQQCQPVR